jgi:predicted Na+-dependent transporter
VPLPSRIRAIAAGYPELIAVLAAAILGLTVQPPLAWLASHQGINVLLAILVFATAVTIDPAALRRLVGAWRALLAALVVGVTVLPALSWAVSRIVSAGSLRDGVLVVGLAPCEIASVATTAMAAGEAAVSAGVLIGSTVAAVALAGPILALEAGRAGVSPGAIIANLALVVALPLTIGLAARACAQAPPPAANKPHRVLPATRVPTTLRAHRALAATRVPTTPRAHRALAATRVPTTPRAHRALAATRVPTTPRVHRALAATRVLATPRAERVASTTALAAVAALVALIAAEVHLSTAYLAVAAALLLFLLGSALVGRALGARSARPTATALLLTTSMRDFAIAAGLAAAAFGPDAAAPLGLYGIAVLIWGTATAGTLRHRAPPGNQKFNSL